MKYLLAFLLSSVLVPSSLRAQVAGGYIGPGTGVNGSPITPSTVVSGGETVNGNVSLGAGATNTITMNASTVTVSTTLTFSTGTTDTLPLLYIDGVNRRVGIGRVPTGTQVVDIGSLATDTSRVNGRLVIGTPAQTGANTLTVSSAAQSGAYVVSFTNTAVSTMSPNGLKIAVTNQSGAASDLYFNVANGSQNIFTVNEASQTLIAGQVGVLTTTPCSTCTVHVVGNGNFTGILRQGSVLSCATGVQTDSDGKFSACVASDARLKTRIYEMPYSENAIDRIHPVMYRWKDVELRDNRLHSGFLAQDMKRAVPSAVVSAGKDTLGIDPNAVLAATIKELQALRKRVAELERR